MGSRPTDGAQQSSGFERIPDCGVLIVTVRHAAGAVGGRTHISEASAALAEQGRRVYVVGPLSRMRPLSWALLAPGRLLRRMGSETAVLLDRYVRRRLLERALRHELQRELPAFIYTQDPVSAYAAVQARKGLQVPVAMVVHYNDSQVDELVELGSIRRGGRTDRAIQTFDERLMPRLDGLVFVSSYMRDHVQTQLPQVRDVPSVVVPNFVRRTEVELAEPPLADCITVGTLDERKNHSYLLRVLAEARKQGHRYTLTLVGPGPHRAALQHLARELGVADQVSFTGVRRDVDRLLSRHRVYVHSSTMENCPFALIEAFRRGLPVVAAPVGGIPEVIGDSGAGRFWDLTDPEAGARILSELLEDDIALSEAAAGARHRFAAKYEAGLVSKQLVDFLDDCVRSRRNEDTGPASARTEMKQRRSMRGSHRLPSG